MRGDQARDYVVEVTLLWDRLSLAFGAFNQNQAVIRVEEDPQEPGFYRQRR